MALNSAIILLIMPVFLWIGYHVYKLDAKNPLYQCFLLLSILSFFVGVLEFYINSIEASKTEFVNQLFRLYTIGAICQIIPFIYMGWFYNNYHIKSSKLIRRIFNLISFVFPLLVVGWIAIFGIEARLIYLINGGWYVDVNSINWLYISHSFWALSMMFLTTYFFILAYKKEVNKKQRKYLRNLLIYMGITHVLTLMAIFIFPFYGVKTYLFTMPFTFIVFILLCFVLTNFRILNPGFDQFVDEIFSSLPNWVVFVNESYHITDVNQSVKGFLNLSKEDIIGAHLGQAIWLKIPKDQINNFKELQENNMSFFCDAVNAKNKHLNMHFTFNKLYNSKNRNLGGVLIGVDVTNLIDKYHKHDLQINQSNRKLVSSSLHNYQRVYKIKNLLNTIQQGLKNENVKNPKIRRQLSKTQDQLEEVITKEEGSGHLEEHLTSIYPDFYTNIHQYNSNLSKNDLEHCSYIRLNLSPHEVARMLDLNPQSVFLARYRLKKKLGLPKADSLHEFIFKLS